MASTLAVTTFAAARLPSRWVHWRCLAMADDGRGAVTGGKRPVGVGIDETAAPAPWAARVSSGLVILYQQVENYLLVPRAFRNTVDMPAVVVLLVALVGGSRAGALMGIPIVATVKVAMSSRRGTGHGGSPAIASADTPWREPAGDRVTGGR
jgi:hypothetical protein